MSPYLPWMVSSPSPNAFSSDRYRSEELAALQFGECFPANACMLAFLLTCLFFVFVPRPSMATTSVISPVPVPCGLVLTVEVSAVWLWPVVSTCQTPLRCLVELILPGGLSISVPYISRSCQRNINSMAARNKWNGSRKIGPKWIVAKRLSYY